MKPDIMACKICRGAREIRLPVHHELAVTPEVSLADMISVQESYRVFPCPECCPTTDESRVAILTYTTECHSVYDRHPDALNHLKNSMAREAVALMLKQGAFSFKSHPSDDISFGPDRTRHKATVGVVSPAHVASMQERINARQFDVAELLVDEACKRISQWGSDFHGDSGPIRKEDANRYVHEALAHLRAALRKSQVER